MRRTLFIVVCLALILSATASMAAAPAKPAGRTPQWWGKAPGQKPIARGSVGKVSQSNIAVQTPQGVKPFTVNAKTKVFVDGVKATITDVKEGRQVAVHFMLMGNNVPLALRIIVPKPTFRGKITAIDSNAITLKNKQGEFHLTVGDATKFRSHGYEGTLADLRVGYGAAAQGKITDNVMAADTVEFIPVVAKGAVVAMNESSITVKTVRQLSIVVAPSAKTVVQIRPRVGPNTKGTLADVKVGAPVNIGFAPAKDGPSQLLWIEVLTGQ